MPISRLLLGSLLGAVAFLLLVSAWENADTAATLVTALGPTITAVAVVYLSYRNDLNKTKFTTLHTKSAEAIAEIYRSLALLEMAFQHHTTRMVGADTPSVEERAEVLRNAYNDFLVMFATKRLFLEQQVCESIERFMRLLADGKTITTGSW